MELREALELYLFFESCGADLPPSAVSLRDKLRQYLYERLSIEEMEKPEALLGRLR
jgi:hypothetical protein